MLKGQNAFVRLLEVSDAQSLLELETKNKEFFQRYRPFKNQEFFTLEGQIERINKSIKQSQEDIGYSFGIFLSKNNELIGNITLTEVVRGDLQSCWIGYYLDQQYNGKGYMTEAVKLVVNYAFHELKLHRIEAGVMLHNLGSIKVLEKAGFHKEGVAKQNVRINGRWEDHQTLAIVNTEKHGIQITRKNPNNLAPPLGDYSHLTIVPKGAELLITSGQVGLDLEGYLPDNLEDQFRNALKNVLTILENENVKADGILKVNIWLTETVKKEEFLKIYREFHQGNPPSMTLVYVSALGLPSLKVEIEVWAAR